MPVPLVVNGVTYQYPKARDRFWGGQGTAWATAMTAVVSHLRSPNLPIATTGQIRLGNEDSIGFRNAANDGNITLFVDSSDRLIYDDGVTQKDLSLTGGGNVQHLSPSVDNTVPRFDGVSGSVIQTSGVTIDDSDNIATTGSITASAVDLLLALVPIGTIIAHWDFDGGLSAPSAPYWVPCDGGTYTVGGVSRTVPDLSGLYLVAYGTENGADIATATWDDSHVGQASNQINIAHMHSVDPASTSTSSNGAHTHSSGSLHAQITYSSSDSRLDANVQAVTDWVSDHRLAATGDGGAAGGTFSSGVNVDGSTASDGAHTHTVDIAATTSSSSLSATQSIQPRSVRVRHYMRAK